MFTFIHAADIHLDSPMRGITQYEGAPQDLGCVTRRAFDRLIDTAIARRVAFIILAGDLYDSDWRDYNTGLFFARQMERLRAAGVDAYVLYGNHDAEQKLTRKLPPLDNVHIFPSSHGATFRDEKLGIALHGRSFARAETTENLVPEYPEPLSGLVNIGVLHTALEGNASHASYAPCQRSELIDKGYAYWALGHVHRAAQIHADPWIVYSGNLQGRSVRETGPKGAQLVTVQDDGRLALESLELDVVRWAHLRIESDSLRHRADLEQQVHDALRREVEDATEGRSLIARLSVRCGVDLSRELLSDTADASGWVAEMRQLAIRFGEGRVCLEKVEILPSARPLEASHQQLAALTDLAPLLAGARDDAAFLADLAGELARVFDALPADLRAELKSDPESSCLRIHAQGKGGAGLVDEILPLALALLTEGGPDRRVASASDSVKPGGRS